MSYGYRYDPYDAGWGGKAQPGLVALRNVTMQRVHPVGDLGILRDKSRCSKRSAHCHGRAWDAAIGPAVEEIPIGTALANFLVMPEVAQMLGVQRVIWGFGSLAAKEWDSRPGQRYWSAYSGPAHDEHVHVELCWDAARTLSVHTVNEAYDRYWTGPGGEDMTPDQAAQLQRIEDNQNLILTYLGSKDPDAVGKAVGRGDILSDVDFKVALAKAEGFNHKTGKPPVAPED